MSHEPTEADIKTVAKVLADEGGHPGGSLHSWRCERPEQFGACDCLAYIARQVLLALRP